MKTNKTYKWKIMRNFNHKKIKNNNKIFKNKKRLKKMNNSK